MKSWLPSYQHYKYVNDTLFVYRGDYRTGKRLNMRKVIPYIASQYRKDKIWLRRTRKSKRQYQIVVAVDDSSSMADNHSKQLAFESLAVISNALQWLEAGDLAVCRFVASKIICWICYQNVNLSVCPILLIWGSTGSCGIGFCTQETLIKYLVYPGSY